MNEAMEPRTEPDVDSPDAVEAVEDAQSDPTAGTFDGVQPESTDDAQPDSAPDSALGTDDETSTDAPAEAGAAAADDELTEFVASPDQPSEITTEQVIEAVLFGADTPLPPARIVDIVGTGSARDVRKHIESLNQRYHQTGASFRIEKLAGGYQMLTLPAFNAWLKRLKQARQESKLSQAAMETLAVVAYKQPVVRAEIEAIRGVAAGEMLNRLRELGLVKIVGRAEDVGHPLLYGTTKRFLDVFGLGSLEDLPTVEELKAPE